MPALTVNFAGEACALSRFEELPLLLRPEALATFGEVDAEDGRLIAGRVPVGAEFVRGAEPECGGDAGTLLPPPLLLLLLPLLLLLLLLPVVELLLKTRLLLLLLLVLERAVPAGKSEASLLVARVRGSARPSEALLRVVLPRPVAVAVLLLPVLLLLVLLLLAMRPRAASTCASGTARSCVRCGLLLSLVSVLFGVGCSDRTVRRRCCESKLPLPPLLPAEPFLLLKLSRWSTDFEVGLAEVLSSSGTLFSRPPLRKPPPVRSGDPTMACSGFEFAAVSS